MTDNPLQKLHIVDDTSASDSVVTIDQSGKVGIGSAIPAGKLDVVGHTELDDVNVSGVVTTTSITISI